MNSPLLIAKIQWREDSDVFQVESENTFHESTNRHVTCRAVKDRPRKTCSDGSDVAADVL